MSDQNRSVSLSSKGLQQFEGNLYEKDFKFVVGDGEYLCPWFIAEFLSPRISALRHSDSTINEFCLELEDPNHYFSKVLSVGFGHSIEIISAESTFFRCVCEELWNIELFDTVVGTSERDLDRETLLSRVNLLWRVGSTSDSDLGLIASRFHEFTVSECRELNFGILEAIVRDPRLVLVSEDSLFEIISDHVERDRSRFSLLEFIRFEYLSVSCMESAISLISESFDQFGFSMWRSLVNRLLLSVSPANLNSRFLSPPRPARLIDSMIVTSFPSDLFELSGKKFSLLYRGSRDGFESQTFHERCDGHRDTVTIIQSQRGYIFGGYTPLAWASGGGYIADDGVRSFIFTVKNPHGLSPRIFRLKQDMKQYSVWCTSGYGPTFGGGNDICIYNHCNTSNSNYVNLGHSYNNDTGMDGRTLLAGESNFTVQELEVFEPIG